MLLKAEGTAVPIFKTDAVTICKFNICSDVNLVDMELGGVTPSFGVICRSIRMGKNRAGRGGRDEHPRRACKGNDGVKGKA